jgi:hypothetical protein
MKFGTRDLHAMLLSVGSFVKSGIGQAVLFLYVFAVKQCDIWEVKNACVRFVHGVAECTVYSLFLRLEEFFTT